MSVDANPKVIVIKAGDSQSFQALVAGSLNKGITWTCTAGAVDANGNFVAPATPSMAEVTATSTADPAKSCSITFQVTLDGILDLSGTYTCNTGLGILTFYQSGTTVYALQSGNILFQGMLNGLLLSGTQTGGRFFDFTFNAAGNQFSGVYNETILHSLSGNSGSGTLQAGVVSVDITPKPSYLMAGATQPFLGLVAGALDKRLTWTASTGSVDANGNYLAPSANTVTVLSAIWVLNPSKVGSVTFPVVAVLPATVITVPPVVTFNWPGVAASVPNLLGCTYTWSLTSGTITAGAGTSNITLTPGAPGPLTLTCKVTNAIGTASQTGTATSIAVPCPIQPVISTLSSLSAWMYGIKASVPFQVGMTYLWSLSGGIITSPNDSNPITFSIGSTGPVVLGCRVSNQVGVSFSQTMTIPVATGPNVTITSPDSVTGEC